MTDDHTYIGTVRNGPLQGQQLRSIYQRVIVPIQTGPNLGPGERGIGQTVYIWSGHDWIAKADDLRDAIINLLHKLDMTELGEVYGMVKARAAYRDDEYPERDCDNCGYCYRGPAVFCCLRCAEAAA